MKTPQKMCTIISTQRWKNGQHITYGGNGFITILSVIQTNYMLTQETLLTNTGWSEEALEMLWRPKEDWLAPFLYFSLQPNET